MRFTPWVAVLALSGCSSTYQEPELNADHPASSDAPVVSPATRIATLHLSEADPVAAVAPAAAAGLEGHEAAPGPAPNGQGHGEGEQDAPSSGGPTDNALYVCPMHPEVTSDEPGQRCPKCGMALVPAKEGGHP